MRCTVSRWIGDGWSRKALIRGGWPSFGLVRFVGLVFVTIAFGVFPAHATIDDAISSALQTIDLYLKGGYTVHSEDEWGGDLGVKERKAIRHTLIKGNDYWFCLGADVRDARIAVHIYDANGRLAETDAWQNGSHAAARALIQTTTAYYIVIEVTDSPVERTHWAMVYATKPANRETVP
ncbi:MAG TPA: hypothetical protein VE242_04300, partial [Chthoniobacterales bacterium]|nr:hypothetical protein [Chthoniobacterales bacterium]